MVYHKIHAFAQNEYCWQKQDDKCFTDICNVFQTSIKLNLSSVEAFNNQDCWDLWHDSRGKKQLNRLLSFQSIRYRIQLKQIKGSTSSSHHCGVRAFPGFEGKKICPVLMTEGYLYMTTVEMLGLGILAINNVLHRMTVPV